MSIGSGIATMHWSWADVPSRKTNDLFPSLHSFFIFANSIFFLYSIQSMNQLSFLIEKKGGNKKRLQYGSLTRLGPPTKSSCKTAHSTRNDCPGYKTHLNGNHIDRKRQNLVGTRKNIKRAPPFFFASLYVVIAFDM